MKLVFIVPHRAAVKWRGWFVDADKDVCRVTLAAKTRWLNRRTRRRNWEAVMRFDFFPDREAEMVAWGRTFARGLSEREGHFGVPEPLVAQMVSAQALLEQAYARAKAPATRTKGAVAEKNAKLREMERLARAIAKRLSGTMQVSDEDRLSLGLNVPKRRVRHVHPPAVGPELCVLGIKGADVTIRLIDAQRPSRRARPDNATGATIFYRAGEDDLTDTGEWKFALNTWRTRLTLHFDPRLPAGTPIWISAWWKNRRDEPSASSQPIRVRLGEGVIHPDRLRQTIGARFEQKAPAQREEQAEAA